MSLTERTPIISRRTNNAPYITLTVATTQLVATCIVLSTSNQQIRTDQCSAVNGWLLAYCSRLLFVVTLSLLAIYWPLWTIRSAVFESCSELANLASFALFIIGAYISLHTSDECAVEQHAIYMLMVALLVINCILSYSPLLCLIACCPCLYLLAPSIIRYLQLIADDRGLPASAIAQLPIVDYPSSANSSWPTECAICLSEFEAGQKLVRLECHQQHSFHQSCLVRWARTSNSCPLCRASLRSNDDDEDDEMNERVALIV